MKYCSDCGQALTLLEKPDKTQPLPYCVPCQRVFQHHPKLLVASFISCGNKLLWMKRGLEPQKGHWAIPAGFMEQGETLQQAAARELWEETGVRIDPGDMRIFMMGTISFISEVYIAFHAEVKDEYCQAGIESLDVGFFSRDELPWDEVAYPQANNSIEQAYDDIEQGLQRVYHAEMTPDKNSLLAINE